MINKVIHYFWFGGKPLPKIALKCIESWKKILPDYEIKRWDESNFDVNIIPYTEQAAKSGKWAFVSDYARYHVLYSEGGVYLDCDVEVLKPLDCFMNDKMFSGFESDNFVAPGLILGMEKNHDFGKLIIDVYKKRTFLLENNKFDLTSVGQIFTEELVKKGLICNNTLQEIAGVKVYPTYNFAPINPNTGEIIITDQTFTIHHYAASWVPLNKKIKMYLVRQSNRYLFLSKLKVLYNKIKL
jgi:mannosyltransferase OCH1-like enzyme